MLHMPDARNDYADQRESNYIEHLAWILLVASLLVGFGLTAFAPI